MTKSCLKLSNVYFLSVPTVSKALIPDFINPPLAVASTAPAAILAPPENGAAATAKEYIPTAAIPETISPITSTAIS